MAQVANKPAVTVAKAAGKAAPAPTVAAPAVAAPRAPLFTLGAWPAKAMGGNTVRAYCYAVAKALAAANPQGFTLAQYAAALGTNAANSNMRQPATGWVAPAGGANGTARQHAAWFAAPAQGWLAPVAQ